MMMVVTMESLDRMRSDAGGGHIGDLKLRRLRAAELAGDDLGLANQHVAACGSCRARLRALDDEQRQFEQDIPFARFAGGVERAARVPRAMPRRTFVRRAWTYGAVGLAAAAGFALFVKTSAWPPPAGNRIKGGAATTATIHAAARDGSRQRAIDPQTPGAGAPAVLQAGDLIRVGYRAGGSGYLAAASIDEAGIVTPLYPQSGPSLAIARQADLAFLPDSYQLTGPGRERVFVFIADRAPGTGAVKSALVAAFVASGRDLGAMKMPSIAGAKNLRTFSWLFQKP